MSDLTLSDVSVRRLLVIRGGAVGDLIVTLPVFGALRQAFPQAWIEVLGHPQRAVLAHHARYANHVVDLEIGSWYRLFSTETSVPDDIADYLHTFDVIISYLATADDVFMQNLKRYCPGLVMASSPHPPPGVHCTDHLLQRVSDWCPHGYDPCPHVYLEVDAVQHAERFWRRGNLPDRGVIAFHPGSGGERKLWPLAGWQQVMQTMAARGWRGIVISGPTEQERDLRCLQEGGVSDWPWASALSLPELAALLARCQAVLSHDSGVAHLAAAVGTTTLALFGPTDPQNWGPRHPQACVLQPCPPQALTLENLTPKAVVQTLDALLQETFAFGISQVPCTIVHDTVA